MKGKMMTAALAVMLAVMLAACALAGCGSDSGNSTNAGDNADNNANANVQTESTDEAREVAVGEELTIELDSNPTTGYQWTMSVRPDPEVLGLNGDWYEAPQTDMMGAPGKRYFRFMALKAGQTSMTFAYSRSFEPDQPPAQTHAVSVTVR